MRQTEMIMVVLAVISTIHVDGSAIPMWEFLSRDEKMSHLYQLFSKQVVGHCHDSSMPDCNKNLLVSGLRQLANMDDNALDKLDPYQRGAEQMIWRAMVGDNRLAARVSQEADPYYTSDTDPLATSGSEHNGLGEESVHINDYVRPSEHTGPYLVGPMVIRVFPDGRPVPGDENRPLPRDEDLEEYKYPRVPSISEIETDRYFFKKPYATPKRNSIGKSIGQRPSFISTNNYYRVDPLFRDHRMPEATNTARTFRYFK